MIVNKLITLIITLIFSLTAFGNKTANISGVVTNECDQMLNHVRIAIISTRGLVKCNYSNANGEFKFDSLNIDVKYKLKFSRSAFFDIDVELLLNNDTFIKVEIEHIPTQIHPEPIMYFDFNSDSVSMDYSDSLMFLIRFVRDNPKCSLEIVGFNDLGEDKSIINRRINYTYKLLKSIGIDEKKLVKSSSTVPNRYKYGDAIYNCISHTYVQESELLTETYIQNIENADKRNMLRQLNRSVMFRVICE